MLKLWAGLGLVLAVFVVAMRAISSSPKREDVVEALQEVPAVTSPQSAAPPATGAKAPPAAPGSSLGPVRGDTTMIGPNFASWSPASPIVNVVPRQRDQVNKIREYRRQQEAEALGTSPAPAESTSPRLHR
ncbi:MAG: hypothetical protein HYV63_07775 [Candidatus Schekmanbacteria bacterium]|nr:hypothetical protein [Candidatus Schekmanbacteria bacterium]